MVKGAEGGHAGAHRQPSPQEEGLRRAEQLVLYNKALQLTVAALQLAKDETAHGRLKVRFPCLFAL